MMADSAELVFVNSVGKWQDYRLLCWASNLELNPIHHIFRAAQVPVADFGPMGFGPQTCSLSCPWLLSEDPGSYRLLQQRGGTLGDTLYLGYFKAKQTATHIFFYVHYLTTYSLILLLTAHSTQWKIKLNHKTVV